MLPISISPDFGCALTIGPAICQNLQSAAVNVFAIQHFHRSWTPPCWTPLQFSPCCSLATADFQPELTWFHIVRLSGTEYLRSEDSEVWDAQQSDWLISLEVNLVTRCYKAEPWSLPHWLSKSMVYLTAQENFSCPEGSSANHVCQVAGIFHLRFARLLLPLLKTGSDQSTNHWTAIESRARQLNLFETAGNVCHPLYLAQVVFFFFQERKGLVKTEFIEGEKHGRRFHFYMHYSECWAVGWCQTPN